MTNNNDNELVKTHDGVLYSSIDHNNSLSSLDLSNFDTLEKPLDNENSETAFAVKSIVLPVDNNETQSAVDKICEETRTITELTPHQILDDTLKCIDVNTENVTQLYKRPDNNQITEEQQQQQKHQDYQFYHHPQQQQQQQQQIFCQQYCYQEIQLQQERYNNLNENYEKLQLNYNQLRRKHEMLKSDFTKEQQQRAKIQSVNKKKIAEKRAQVEKLMDEKFKRCRQEILRELNMDDANDNDDNNYENKEQIFNLEQALKQSKQCVKELNMKLNKAINTIQYYESKCRKNKLQKQPVAHSSPSNNNSSSSFN